MKSCLLPYKESKLNMLDHLVKKGYINSDRVLQEDYYFKGKPYIERLLEDINTNYELALTELFDVKKTYVKSFAGGSDIFIPRLEPIEDAFNQIDAKRQELGIYNSRMSIGDYNKSKQATEVVNESIKPGVLELFEENPELSSIGTAEEYSQYLDSIFPNSKVKDIVYRGNENKLDGYFDNNTNLNFYDRKGAAVRYSRDFYDEYVIQANLVNVQTDNEIVKNTSDNNLNDGTNEIIVKPNQTYILGSKQDIEGFKEFLKKDDESIYYKNLEDEIKVLEEDKVKSAQARRNFREWMTKFTTLNEVKNDNQKLLESRRQVFKGLGFTETYDNTFELKTSSYVTLISKKQALDDNPLIRFDGKLTGVKYTQKSVDGMYILTYKLDDITKTSIREAQIKGEMPFTKSDLKETLKSEDFLNSVAENIFDGLSPEDTQIIKEKLDSGEYNINCKL